MNKHIVEATAALNLENFSLLEFPQKSLDKLRTLFDPEKLIERLEYEDTLIDVSDDFKRILGIINYFS